MSPDSRRYDLIIIGLGPAGVAAAVYAGRDKLRTLVLGEQVGGQSAVSTTIQNWIGTLSISGAQMAAGLSEHLETVNEDVSVRSGAVVTSMAKIDGHDKPIFQITTANQEVYESTTVLIASGSRRRKLEIPGEEEFLERGVSYCTICEAPLMLDNKVAVIGGGNAGLEAVIDLLPYASHIYLLEITGQLGGEMKIREIVLQHEKTSVLFHARPWKSLGSNQLKV